MYFSSIRLYCFRNLCDEEISLRGKDIFLVGENAQGKSNFLESVYFCSFASSFRNAPLVQLVKSGGTECSVAASLLESGGEQLLIKVEGGKKQNFLDGKRCVDRKKLLFVIPSIVFCHEDLSFINGGQERRRWFFDQNKSLYDTVYLDDLRRYKKILKTRNFLLKEIKETNSAKKKEVLDMLDPQLVEYGLQLVRKREEETKWFSPLFQQYFEEISRLPNIGVQYKPDWRETDNNLVLEHVQKKRETEIRFGTTLSGPHRDKYFFKKDNAEFSETASTGQKRLLALLLRVVQAQRFSAITGKKPVLLLDDVLLELDGKKREKFLYFLPEYNQAFYTFLPEEPYKKYHKFDTQIFRVHEGKLIDETTK
jgi:DNA replication and repair protein RecF